MITISIPNIITFDLTLFGFTLCLTGFPGVWASRDEYRHLAPDVDPEIFGGKPINKFVEDFLATRNDCGGCVCKYPCFKDHCIEPQSCFNGGKVVFRGEGALPECECLEFFEGQCCKNKVCTGGGSLKNGTCHCKYPEYQYGEHCENARCRNGGTPNEGFCKNCPWLWAGPFCDQLNCVHGGIREVRDGTQMCICPQNGRFFGEHCHRVKCEHGGVENIYSGNCECVFLFNGQFCEEMNSMAWGVVGGIFLAFLVLLIYCCWKPVYRKCIEIRTETAYQHSNSQVQLIKVNSVDALSIDSYLSSEKGGPVLI